MANLELHNPEDTCSFADAEEYNTFMAPLWGETYEKLTAAEFVELRTQGSCPVPGAVEVGTEATYTPTGSGPESVQPSGAPVAPAASARASSASAAPGVAPVAPVAPGAALFPYPCPSDQHCITAMIPNMPIQVMMPRVDWRGVKILAGGLGLLAATFLGYLIRRGM